MPATAERNKAIYQSLHDRIIDKRFQSASPVRRYAHRTQYDVICRLVPPGSTVLDAGCGEGVLSTLLARQGCTVTGVDLSAPNVAAAKEYANSEGMAERVTFVTGDVEALPVADKTFDYVVSSHVLEHIPDFEKGARELSRVARKRVIIAIPTCLSLCSMALLGRDSYWAVSRKTLLGIPRGALRVLWALMSNQEGVNEGYQGDRELIHIFRFPWKGKASIEAGGLQVLSYRASCYPFPYCPFLLPISRLLDRAAGWPILRNLGYGTTYTCEPCTYGSAKDA